MKEQLNITNQMDVTDDYRTCEKELRKEVMGRIQAVMGEKDIKNKKIAELCAVYDSTASNWVKRNTVPLLLLSRLHTKYGIDLNSLICGEDMSRCTEEWEQETIESACAIMKRFLEAEVRSSQNEK